VGGEQPAGVTAIGRSWRTAEALFDDDGFH
jgi:hypothetical protein